MGRAKGYETSGADDDDDDDDDYTHTDESREGRRHMKAHESRHSRAHI